MSDKKSVLILNQHAPYGTSYARDALDVALTCSIFEMPVSLAFLGDGLFQLLKNQNTEQTGHKNIESMLSALPMYDIDQVFICSEDLETNALSESDLALPVQIISQSSLSNLIDSHDTVLTF
ncbi:sulfurtransferase complex subunit TusC [Neptuniibacter sp. QD29_5]|uniref:sulfurtransferase complex subunit TusC n=1 Tax=Neptuniibacter sp. QD29_5 TaxID=3398207 RepID=UPI0039F467AD